MQLDFRGWGTAVLTVVLGMGCSSTSPIMSTASGAGGGATTLVARAGVSPIEQALSQADGYFITQYRHTRYNPDQNKSGNANCGPTSLAMAFKAYGVEPAGLDSPEHAHDLILYTRKLMTGSMDENTWTYPVQVQSAARQAGLKSEMIFTLNAIQNAMAQPGHMVVVNVNPTPAYVDELVYPYNGGHFALVTAISGNKVYLNDPLASGPLVISLAQLGTALTTPLGNDPGGRYVPPFDGGIAVWQ